MLLVLDMGNTTTMVGVYDGNNLLKSWRLVSERMTSDEFGIMILNFLQLSGIDHKKIDGGIMSSVVPSLDNIIQEGIKNYLSVDPVKVSSQLDLGMYIDMDNPSELGADRIVNAIAGIAEYGAPVIVADFGTAITLDVVSKEGSYVGGAIMPGLVTSVDALFGKTSKLPQISLEIPPKAIGKNTKDCIRSGVIFGTAGMIDGLVKRIWDELGYKCPVVATGGHAATVAKVSDTISAVESDLTLKGLWLVYQRLNAKATPCA